MPWSFVGRGRKLAVYDHRLPAYVAFWQRTLDNARRLAQRPTAAADLAPTDADVRALGGLPNFDLYAHLVPGATASTTLVLVFALAAPFAAVADDPLLLGAAETAIAVGAARPAVWSRADTALTHSRHYRALVLRVTYLSHLVELLRKRNGAAAALERAAELWRSAHTMLTLALDELAAVPADADSDTWATLLRHFAPDVNMFLHAGEMPDVGDDLRATPILKRPPDAQSVQNKTRAANLVRLAFSKVCPRRCGMRDLVEITLEYALRNVASLHFIMLIMAASYLGIYEHCRRRPDWPMVRDVYRLFFFQMPAELAARRASDRPSEAAALTQRFRIERTDIYMYIVRGNPRVHFSRYDAALRDQYRAAAAKAEKAVVDPAKRPRAAAAGGGASADGGTRTTARQRAESIIPTMATMQAGASSAVPIVVDDDEAEMCAAAALTNAAARLEADRQRGADYYEQRRAAGTLPLINGKPQEFISADTSITDVFALRHITDADRCAPTPVEMARRNAVFRMLSTVIEYDSQRTTSAAAADARSALPSKEYPFTHVLTQQIREFMFALLAHDRPLADELCARVPWRSWQASVVAINDLLRQRLSDAYRTGGSDVPFLRRHQVHYRVASDASAPRNNLYATENPPFVAALHRTLAAMYQSPRFLDLRVDRVVPREYGIIMAELLRFYAYPRSYAESAVPVERDELASTTESASAADDVPTLSAPFVETVAPALPPFCITLTKALPADDADEEAVQTQFVRRLQFPGRVFHMTPATIDAFNRTVMAYCGDTDDSSGGGTDRPLANVGERVLVNFARSLATTSVFQFMLVYTFVRALDAYLSIYTVPLPEHVVRQQMRVACARYGCVDPARVPRHAHYSLVCVSCRRFAGFLATPRRPNMRYADGTNDVRSLDTADDQIVAARVRERGRLLAPDELTGAVSMYEVLYHQAMRTTAVYDHYTRDPIETRIEAERRSSGYYEAFEPYDPCTVDTTDRDMALAQRLLASVCDRERELAGVSLPDWRVDDPIYALDADGRVATDADALRGTPLPPLQPVATDGRLESDVAFRRRVRDLYNRLMGGRFLLLGQRIATPDALPFIAATDSRRQIRQELKKQKAQAAMRARIATIDSAIEQKRETDKLWRKCCRDITTLVRHVHCSSELMLQFSRIGNALVIVQRGRSPNAVDIIIDCCGCGTSVQFADVATRGDLWFCPTCIVDGTWSAALGGSGGADGDADASLLGGAARDIELTLGEQLATPNRAWLPDAAVRRGDKCVHPKCRRCHAPGTPMVSIEVVFDAPGKERIGRVPLCLVHQRMFPWIFTLPFIPTRSMLGVLLHDGKTSVSIDELRTCDYLDLYMTRLADISAPAAGGRSRAGGKPRRRTFLEPLE